ncbi:hypothetical protein C0J52_15596 [Blattella germanica]|nr:hypothetical protein C0J52_15596 [Blattella germanica]
MCSLVVHKLPWSSRMPGLSPIEHIWNRKVDPSSAVCDNKIPTTIPGNSTKMTLILAQWQKFSRTSRLSMKKDDRSFYDDEIPSKTATINMDSYNVIIRLTHDIELGQRLKAILSNATMHLSIRNEQKIGEPWLNGESLEWELHVAQEQVGSFDKKCSDDCRTIDPLKRSGSLVSKPLSSALKVEGFLLTCYVCSDYVDEKWYQYRLHGSILDHRNRIGRPIITFFIYDSSKGLLGTLGKRSSSIGFSLVSDNSLWEPSTLLECNPGIDILNPSLAEYTTALT